MKKLFAIITMFMLAAGVSVAQDAGKKAEPTAANANQKAVSNKCDMKNFCCMRAGRMTRIENGLEVGMAADMTLKSGAKIKTNGTLTDAKGKTASLKEGDAIDMDGNLCVMGLNPALETADPVQAK